MSANNGNTTPNITSNGTKPQTTQFTTPNITSNGTKPQTTQFTTSNITGNGTKPQTTPPNNLDPTSDETNPEKIDPELNPLELKELQWFRPIELVGVVLGAILVPVIVGFAGLNLSNSQFDIQQIDNKHTILKEYIDGISSLNLDKDLTEDEDKEEVKERAKKIKSTLEKTLKSNIDSTKKQLEVLQSIKTAKDLSDTSKDARTMAKAQTQTALRRLDGEHKGYLIRFLHESNLINDKAVIKLSGANINDVKLKDASLPLIQLEGTYLNKADLSNAGLQGANFQEANLQGANLQGAKLQPANLQDVGLQRANFQGAKLQGADLRGADLRGADFQGADFQGADFQGADFQGANIQGVKNWQQACYDEKLNEYLGLTKQDRDRNCKDKEPL